MNTSELTDGNLDWAVGKALDTQGKFMDWKPASYSHRWDLAGPIIEREGISILDHGVDDYPQVRCEAFIGTGYEAEFKSFGPTPLIAAMRAYVASKLGNEVLLPGESK
jgi:hypothetical protein